MSDEHRHNGPNAEPEVLPEVLDISPELIEVVEVDPAAIEIVDGTPEPIAAGPERTVTVGEDTVGYAAIVDDAPEDPGGPGAAAADGPTPAGMLADDEPAFATIVDDGPEPGPPPSPTAALPAETIPAQSAEAVPPQGLGREDRPEPVYQELPADLEWPGGAPPIDARATTGPFHGDGRDLDRTGADGPVDGDLEIPGLASFDLSAAAAAAAPSAAQDDMPFGDVAAGGLDAEFGGPGMDAHLDYGASATPGADSETDFGTGPVADSGADLGADLGADFGPAPDALADGIPDGIPADTEGMFPEAAARTAPGAPSGPGVADGRAANGISGDLAAAEAEVVEVDVEALQATQEATMEAATGAEAEPEDARKAARRLPSPEELFPDLDLSTGQGRTTATKAAASETDDNGLADDFSGSTLPTAEADFNGPAVQLAPPSLDGRREDRPAYATTEPVQPAPAPAAPGPSAPGRVAPGQSAPAAATGGASGASGDGPSGKGGADAAAPKRAEPSPDDSAWAVLRQKKLPPTVLEYGGEKFLMADNAIRQMKSINEYYRHFTYVLDFQESLSVGVTDLHSELKYADVMLRKHLEEQGEMGRDDVAHIYAKSRKGKNETNVFYQVYPRQRYQALLQAYEGYDPGFTIQDSFGLLFGLLRSLGKKQPRVLAMRMRESIVLVAGRGENVLSARRIMMLGDDENSLTEGLFALQREMEPIRHALGDEIEAIDWIEPLTRSLKWKPHPAWKVPLKLWPVVELENPEGRYYSALPTIVGRVNKTTALGPKEERVLRPLELGEKWLWAALLLLVIGLGAGMVYLLRTSNEVEEANVALLRQIKMVEQRMPKLPHYQSKDLKPVLAMADTINLAAYAPSPAELWNRLAATKPTAVRIDEVSATYRLAGTDVALRGEVELGLAHAQRVYAEYLEALQNAGFRLVAQSIRLDIQGNQFNVALDLPAEMPADTAPNPTGNAAKGGN
jgi:hypothetical protein